eukprot:scaffold1.g5455.t1
MAGRLQVEVEEEVPLLDNAAAASLLSPGIWVQRPSRTAGLPGFRDAEPDRPPDSCGRVPMDHQPTLRLADPTSDPDLAYLQQITDDSAERERRQQDAEHLAALEDAHVRLKEGNLALEAALAGQVAGVKEVLEENATIKQLLAALQARRAGGDVVRKEDFLINPDLPPAEQAAAMQAVGLRLIANLCQQPAAAAAAQKQQQQQQQPAGSEGSDRQRQQREQQAGGPSSQGAPSPSHDLITPGPAAGRPGSPRIPALRGGLTPQQEQQQQQVGALLGGPPPRPAVPSTPANFPAEAQIAAAALTMTEGDPTEALITLLDKAMLGRRAHHMPPPNMPAA